MEYRGQVQQGVVVFEGALTPPDGTKVRIEILDAVPAQDPQNSTPTIWEKLRKFSGVVKDLPADMARNHDHYIHGGPRR